MPQVRKAVSHFSCEPLVNLNPDEVVALGAFHFGPSAGGNHNGPDLLLLAVIPLSLGLKPCGGWLNARAAQPDHSHRHGSDFTTYQDGSVTAPYGAGERDPVADRRKIGPV
jgi:molecular chaperone HscA